MTGGNRPNKAKKPKGSTILYAIYAVIILGLCGMLFGGGGTSTTKEIDWEKLEPILLNHYYEKIVVVNQEFAQITLTKEALKKEEYKDLQSSIKPNTNISKYVKVNAPIKEDNEWVVVYNVTPYYPLALVLDILVLLDSGQGDEIVSYIFDSLKFGGRFSDALLDNFDIFIGLSVDGFKQAHDPGTMLFYLNQILPN